ncbi:PQQ-dependent sugar dehydrogenase [Pedobacter sp. MW01-1-1]|uniref:PQQ-dependent sugar dehydrogenase n=1 Tax=Pedobacter sp. MW01-1-1 TaxID=3383027 RepID=UPI003FEEBFCF
MRNYSVIVCLILLAACGKSAKELRILDNIQLKNSLLKVEVLADSLNVPWDICYGNDHSLWFVEQEGLVSRIDLETGEQKRVLKIEDVWHKRTAGLLGLAVHPNLKEHPYVLMNYTVKRDSTIYNKLVRYEFDGDTLKNPKILLEVDGFTAHNGSRIAFGPDEKIYWATGDAHKGENAQNPKSLNGKILRINIDGTIPQDNPKPKSYVWASGFRNMQGLTFSDKGLLYTSEHGDAIEDEINLIEVGANYGWPVIEGMHDLPAEKEFSAKYNTLEPIKSWTPVIAPAGITHYNSMKIGEWSNSLLLTTLKGKSLRVIKLSTDGKKAIDEEIFFEKYYGRLRDVCTDREGAVYLTTSNKDWNPTPGFPLAGDDKILKISPAEKAVREPLKGLKVNEGNLLSGKALYNSYCASCHKEDGMGLSGVFPALKASTKVTGQADQLIHVLLKGVPNQNGTAAMPAFTFLKDEEAAAILSYIRQNWGNAASSIVAAQIKKHR